MSLDNGQTPRPVRLLRVGPEEIVMLRVCLGLSLATERLLRAGPALGRLRHRR